DDYQEITPWVDYDNLNTDYTHYRVSIRHIDKRDSSSNELQPNLIIRHSSLVLHPLTGSDWAIGPLVPVSTLQPEYSGDAVTDYTRLRNANIKVKSGSKIVLKKTEVLKYRYLFYPERDVESYEHDYISYTKEPSIITKNGYIRILLSHDDDREITDMTELYP